MPRLVLKPVALCVASTACLIRAPTLSLARPIERCRGFGGRLEIGDAHAMAVAVAMHVAGLQRVELRKAGIVERPRDRRSL